MDKVLVTTLLTMAAVVAAVMVVNTMLPALGRSTSAVLSSSTAASNRLKTDTEIIHVATDTSNPTKIVNAWVKNVGAANIDAIDLSDLFFLKTSATTSFARLTYGANPCTADCWEYCIEGTTCSQAGTPWKPGDTIKITIRLGTLATGDYLVRFITHNAVAAEKEFTV